MKYGVLLLFLVFDSFLYSERIIIPDRYNRNIQPEFLRKSESRTYDNPILSVESYRISSDFHLDETNCAIDTDDLFDGCVIFVSVNSMQDFCRLVLPKIKTRFILLSHGGEPFESSFGLTWDTYYLSKYYLTPQIVSNPYVIAYFGKNVLDKYTKAFPIPLGKVHFFPEQTKVIRSNISNLELNSYFEEKKNLIYLNINPGTHPSRRAVMNHWRNQPSVVCASRSNFKQYFKEMKNSRFIISPRGFGIDCFRTWEALYAGSIPVVESHGLDSFYEGLPVIVVADLTKITVKDLEEEYERMKNKSYDLDRLFIDYWMRKIRSMVEK
jgi:hypothetical protein